MANQLAQIGHACLGAGSKFLQPEKNGYIVILAVNNEAELLETTMWLETRGVKLYIFYEPDYPTGYTAACTAPLRNEQRKWLRRFRLWQ